MFRLRERWTLPTVMMVCLLVAVGLLMAGCAGLISQEPQKPEEDYPEAPSFSIPQVDISSDEMETQATEFFSDFDAPVYAIFFTTTCPSCVQKVIDLHEQVQSWEQRGLSVVIVSGSGVGDTAGFFRERDLQYEVYVDKERAAFTGANVQFVPTGMLVNRENQVVLRTTGWTDDVLEEIESEVESILD